MKFSTIPSLVAAVAPLAASFVGASPVATEQTHSLERRVVTSAPHFVAYWDAWLSGENGPPDVSQLAGFNTLIMAFLLASGTADQAQEWASLDAGTRSSIHSAYSAAGINLLVSAFGSTENPTSSGFGAASTASTMAAWVKTYGLDGIDVDYEDFTAINKADGSAESWLITFTQSLRSALPAGQYIITHAPVAPWFSPIYTAGAYTKVNQQVGSIIDWYNVQFYNQGSTEYTTCAGLLTASSSAWPDSSVFQIHSTAGVDLSKIVIGKPGTTADASNGYIDAGTFASCLAQGKASGWTGGAMVWQFPHVAASWIQQVRASSWPYSGTVTTPPPATTTSTAGGSGSTGSSGSCAGVSAWNSAVAYTGGQTVTYGGYLWTAQWWTEADTPGGAAGVWTKGAQC